MTNYQLYFKDTMIQGTMLLRTVSNLIHKKGIVFTDNFDELC
jgi:hypothetical protein